ncbi:MAG: chorismate-binding protein [Bacteroidetes bacterium]|nr:chorismate-binding protein [Bacteroidota bacterium]
MSKPIGANPLPTFYPAGSISGAPKKKTLEIIREAGKQKQRILYGGCFF